MVRNRRSRCYVMDKCLWQPHIYVSSDCTYNLHFVIRENRLVAGSSDRCCGYRDISDGQGTYRTYTVLCISLLPVPSTATENSLFPEAHTNIARMTNSHADYRLNTNYAAIYALSSSIELRVFHRLYRPSPCMGLIIASQRSNGLMDKEVYVCMSFAANIDTSTYSLLLSTSSGLIG
jgi:hypothetical protein